jgi:hypothetical protein
MNGKRELLATQLPIPVSFCCLDLESDFFEYSTRVLSVFNDGFVITSPRRLRRGSFLSLRLRIPSNDFDGTYWEHRCMGRVTAIESRKDREVGYKVELEETLLS